jgi:hypothetical protein
MYKLISYLTSFVAVCFTVCAANASVVTYHFSGTITYIRGNGAGQTFGDTFEASFVYDDAPAVGQLIEPNRELYASGQFEVSVGGHQFVGTPSSELQVFNNWTSLTGGYDSDDGFFVISHVYDIGNPANFYSFRFDMWDFTGTVLNSLEVPSQAKVVELASNGRILIVRFEDGTNVGESHGTFNAFSASPSVPEPSTGLLVVLGLSGLLLKRRMTATL